MAAGSLILAATGHRPHKLGGYDDATFARLVRLAGDALSERSPKLVISGMALGWDQAVAQAAVCLGIPFLAAVPFEGQARRWPKETWPRYCRLIEAASAVEIVSEFPGVRALALRNEWMVDRAHVMLALWDGSWGGTFNCIQYASRKGVPVENVWTRWAGWAGDMTSLLT